MTITVTPDKGQTLKDLEVLDKSGNSLPLTDLGNGKFSSVMPVGKVTVKAEFGEARRSSIRITTSSRVTGTTAPSNM